MRGKEKKKIWLPRGKEGTSVKRERSLFISGGGEAVGESQRIVSEGRKCGAGETRATGLSPYKKKENERLL